MNGESILQLKNIMKTNPNLYEKQLFYGRWNPQWYLAAIVI